MTDRPSDSARSALASATGLLSAAGVASPRVEAELLLAHVLGRKRSQLLLAGPIGPRESAGFDALVRRRAQGVPLQHLTGAAPFRRLELAVGPGVFIPRPETELIVELAADRLATATTVADLCAGSGAIGLAVANEYPAAKVILVERSAAALAWLRRNADARRAAGDPEVRVVAGDVSAPGLLADHSGAVDVVLSNPPYVPTSRRHEVGAEVGHDPEQAVFAAGDGLAVIAAVAAVAARLLRVGGLLAIEHDDSHERSAPDVLARRGEWTEVLAHRDLAGRPRFVTAIRGPRRAGGDGWRQDGRRE